MLKFVRILILVLVAAAVVSAVAFRTLAAMREQYDPATSAGSNGKFAEVKGFRIHYREWGPEDGPPILLVHGTMAWSETWRDIAAPLGEAGFRTIALDLPPFGLSDRPSARNYSRKAQAAFIRGFTDALGLRHFALVGHSFGGGATMEAAFSMPERIERLILLDVALGLGSEGSVPPLIGLLQARWLRNVAVSATFTNPLMIAYGLRDFVHDDGLVTDERVAIYEWPLGLENTTDAVGDWLLTGLYGDETSSLAADPANYAAFAQPVLVIWGREDTVTPLPQGERIAGLFPSARLEVLEGVNHIPHIEKPREVTNLIEAFLRPSSATGAEKAAPFASRAQLRGTVRLSLD